MEPDGWRGELTAARLAQGISQEKLAVVAGVSRGMLQAIEHGRRHPSRVVLRQLLDALKLERAARARILMGAGFVADAADPDATYYFTEAEARAEIEARPWPACVVTELMEVIAANDLLQRLWGVDLERELNTRVARNILSVISLPRFRRRLLNRDECVSIAFGVMKGNHAGPETAPLGPSPDFQAVIRHFMEGDPALVARIFELWAAATPVPYKARWVIPVRWRDPHAGDMRFEMLLNSANEPEGYSFQDWIPVDAATWDALERLRSRR
ncbi:MAG: helix-turn-helix domain-containing protein [Chloroflexi bacterium]|nr:helix-turn-helix domain-containing protein [Chloroflexota bacterium]